MGKKYIVFQTDFCTDGTAILIVKNIHDTQESKQIEISIRCQPIMVTMNGHLLIIGSNEYDGRTYMMSFASPTLPGAGNNH